MAIAFDAASSLGVGTGDRTFSHDPVGTPRGVLVIVVSENGDTVVGATYAGATLTEVPLSPLLHTTPETGSVHAFFLGTGVPTTDPATVAIDVSGVDDYIAACFTVTAAKDTKVHDTSTFDSGATTAPSATLTITADSFVAGGLYSGLAAPGATEVAGTTQVVTGDFGADNGEISRGDSIKTTDFAYGWTQASDDGAVLAVAISESDDATGTGAITVPAATVAGTGAEVFTATGAIVVPTATVAGTGDHVGPPPSGTGAISVPAATVAGTGSLVLTGTGAITGQAPTVAGSGAEVITGTGAISVPAPAVAGSGSGGEAAPADDGLIAHIGRSFRLQAVLAYEEAERKKKRRKKKRRPTRADLAALL